MNEQYHEQCAEMLSQLRHALKMALGKFCEDNQDSDYLDDDVIIAAAASLLCEMLVNIGADIDEDVIQRLRGTHAAIQTVVALQQAKMN